MSGAVLKLASGTSHNALSGALSLPLRGVGEARLELDADGLPLVGSGAELVLARDDGTEPASFRGTIVLAGAFGGRARVTMALGAGKLSGPLALELGPRNYVAAPTPVSVVAILADILDDAGEQLAAGVADALAGLTVSRWHRAAGTGKAALDALFPALSWRLLPDGTVWAGVETWPPGDDKGLLLQGDDGDAYVLDVAPEHASVLPGQVVLGRRVNQIVYSVGSGLRAEVFYPEASA